MLLEGVLVDLFPFTERFQSHMRDWINGPMREWWNEDGLLTRSQWRRDLEEHRQRDQGRAARFGMRAKDGELIGLFGLFNIDYHNRIAEVGAGIGNPDYWGGGFGSDAMLLVVQYGFDWLDLRRLYLDTFGHNLRAQRQVEKCGFTLEARQRVKMRDQSGVYRDWMNYGLLREEWPGYNVMVERLGLREKARERGYTE